MLPVTDVRWTVALFIVLFSCLEQLVSSQSFSCSSDQIITGDTTFNPKGEIISTDFPAHYDPVYFCTFRFNPTANDEYLELIFSDFILESKVARPCTSIRGGRYSVTIEQTAERRTSQFCARPGRQVLPLSGGEITVELLSWEENALKAFRATYRYLEQTEGERLLNQITNEITAYNYDRLENYQGSIKDETIVDNGEVWVDVLHYITAPPGHMIALTVAFMQDVSTTMLEIHDGSSSQAPQLAQLNSRPKAIYSSTQESIYARVYGTAKSGITMDIDFTFFKDLGADQLCFSDYFQCTSNDHCIPSKLVCNGVDNCYDGTSDEDLNGECRGDDTGCEGLCENGGICFGESCVCIDGYDGLFCEIGDGDVMGHCDEGCLNGGTCDSFNECQCPDGYFGVHCEYADNTGDGTDYTDLQHTSIMIGAFVGAVCLLSICWLIAMARKRQTDVPGEGRLHRIISVHSPEESGLRRQSTIVAQSNVELPPNYSEAVLYRDGSVKGGSISRPTRKSLTEPMSPPPSYDAVASDNEDDGIVFRIPETVHEDESGESDESLTNGQSEQNALPDVVTLQEGNPPITRHDTPV